MEMNRDVVEINGVKCVREGSQSPNSGPSDVRIVVLQRGWVVVGNYSEVGDDVFVNNASVIRKWGTTKGLGQLAVNGPTSDTVLDPCGSVKTIKLGVCFTLDCEASNWSALK